MGLIVLSTRIQLAECKNGCCAFFLLKEGDKYIDYSEAPATYSEKAVREELESLLRRNGVTDTTAIALIEGAVQDYLYKETLPKISEVLGIDEESPEILADILGLALEEDAAEPTLH